MEENRFLPLWTPRWLQRCPWTPGPSSVAAALPWWFGLMRLWNWHSGLFSTSFSISWKDFKNGKNWQQKLLKKCAFTLFTFKSWDIHILGKWGIKEDHFNWGHLGKHCIWTTLHYADPKGITAVIILGFWWNIDHFDVISTENLRISTI